MWQFAHQRLASVSPLKASAARAAVLTTDAKSRRDKVRYITSLTSCTLALTFEPFEIADQIADLTGIQPELGHIPVSGDNAFAERFLK